MEKDLNKNENISKFDNHSKTDKLENSFFLQKFDHKNRKLIEKMKKKNKKIKLIENFDMKIMLKNSKN